MEKLFYYEPSNNDMLPHEKNIVHNGICFGTWDNEANINYPEDLTLERDLSYLIKIGIRIGLAIASENKLTEI